MKYCDEATDPSHSSAGGLGVEQLETHWGRARKTRSEQQEARIGKMEGGSRQVNSGRLWRWKRDNKLWEFLIEARTTEAGSYRVEAAEFRQIQKEAFQTPPGCLPAMQIDIQEISLIALRLTDFQDLYTRLLDLEARVAQHEANE